MVVDEDAKLIPIIDCPICGEKDVSLSYVATMTKGGKTIEVWECSNCGKVPNVAEALQVKRYVSIKEMKAMGWKIKQN